MFKQFECFESEVYYGIIASIFVISFVISVYKHSLKSFFTTFWSYLSVILSNYQSIRTDIAFERLFSGLWLMTCLILLRAFSGKLRDRVIERNPILWIDSWEDLYELKQMKIFTSKGTDLANFIYMFNNSKYQDTKGVMARDFGERVSYSIANGNDRNLPNIIDFDEVRSGRLAIVYNFDYLQIFKQNLTDYGLQEDFDFHISNPNRKSELLFTMYNKEKMTKEHQKIWNFVYDLVFEWC